MANGSQKIIVSLVWLVIWGYLAWNNNTTVFYWIGFFSSFFIGLWIIDMFFKIKEKE